MAFLENALKGAMNEESKALAQLLDMAKEKLVEAGSELLAATKGELEGLTVTVTIQISKKASK